MRAKHFITELFRPGQDINFKWSRPFKDEVNVLGKTPQGHELSINFWEITDDIVAIDFTIDADVEQDPDPDTSPKSGHELTRHGEEFAVFTQVVNAITQYLNKLPKNNVFFQVKRTEAQREPLYLKIANRVAKQLGFRQGTEQELEATNPGLYNKFDNRYSKLLWYTNTPQGMAEGSETHKYQVVVKGHKRSYSVWVDAKNEDVAIIRAQQYVAREHNDTAKRAAVVDMKQGVAEGEVVKGPWSGMNKPEPGERYVIIRTKPDGEKDFAAGTFDSWQRAKEELQKFLDHSLHTKFGHKFEIIKKQQGVAEGLNEFALDGFNGGGGDEGFSPEIAKMAQEDGFTKGVGLADGATLERAMKINHWHARWGGMYKLYFAKGFKAGRMNKINHDNKQYNLNLKLMKDGSIRHGEQDVAEDAVEDLEKDLKEPHSYDAIDHMMKTIAREEGITAKELHNRFVDKHSMTPDDWIKNKLAENFKDGKNPGRKGLSKRMGVNTKASVSALRKVAKNSSGEKQRMAHWLANMKSGRKKS
jgi:hypothetical protein